MKPSFSFQFSFKSSDLNPPTVCCHTTIFLEQTCQTQINNKAKHLTNNKPMILIILPKTNGIHGETKSIFSVNQSILQHTPRSDRKNLPMYPNYPSGGRRNVTHWSWQVVVALLTGVTDYDGSYSQKINMGQPYISREICQCS
jgi:hypothetical protein